MLGEVGAELLSGVGDTEDVDQQLGELEGAGSNLLCLQSQCLVATATCDHCLLVTQGADAGAGGCNSNVPVPGVECLDVVLDDFVAVIEVTGVDVHLGAAGLVRGEDNLVAQALKNFDGGACYAGVHAVNDARGEECNAHDLSVLSSVFRVSRSHRLRLGQAGHSPNKFGLPKRRLRCIESGKLGRWVPADVHAPSGGGMRWDQKPW